MVEDVKDVRVLCERGFTLVELMISIVISSVVVAGGYAILTTTHKATISNERAVGTQQNIRVAMELIARDIKQAGFGMPMAPNTPVGGTAGNCATGAAGTTAAAIRPVDNNSAIPLTAVNDTGADTISLVVPRTNSTNGAILGWVLTSPAPAGGISSTITLTNTAVTEMVAEGMQNGSGAYVSLGGAMTMPVISSSGATITLGNTIMAPMYFQGSVTPGLGTQVYLLQCVTYQVQTGSANCGSAGPCLTRTVDTGTAPTVTTSLVDGVEDLQFAYACDGCNSTINAGVPNSVIDDFNGSNTFDVADFQTNRVWAFGTFDPATIRLAQINIVARQTAIDQGTGEGIQAGALSAPLQISDHLPSNDAGYAALTYQSFRRRFLTRTVDTRNMQ